MQVGAVYLVDGAGQTPGWTHRSIDDAATVAMPGATIRVVGLTDGAGNPVAYSDNSLGPIPGQPAESFPIDLKTGVTLEPYDPTIPVYIWSTSTAGAATLIDVVESPFNSADVGPTRIEGMRIAAAGRGIKIHHASDDYAVLIKDCWFAHLGNAVDAKATGVTTSVAVRNCQIRDDTLPYSPLAIPPAPVPESRGILFEAGPGTQSGVLLGEVTALKTSGSFTSMVPVPWDISSIDLANQFGISNATRLIEVVARTGTDEYTSLGDPNSPFARAQIPEVVLTVNGGDLDGGAADGVPTGGWDVGLYAHAEGDGFRTPATAHFPDTFNFNAGFDVSISGAIFRSFALSGIVGATFSEARGAFALSGDTVVQGSGPGQIPGQGTHNGIHLYSEEGYLALEGADALVSDHAGNGIWLNYGGEHGTHHGVPEGLFLGVQRFAVHGNGRNGFALTTATSMGNKAGVVGGTSHEDESLVLHRLNEHEGFAQSFGTGFLNSSAVSNNGASGIRTRIVGVGFDPQLGTGQRCATASFRCTNNAIWNNPGGGISILLEDPIGVLQWGGLCLMPVTHCTLVNNGGAGPGGWSIEVDDSATSGGRYEVDHYPYDATILRTRIFNSVMFRDYTNPGSTTLKDFGPNLESSLIRFDGNNPAIYPVPTDRVGAAGNRAQTGLLVPGGLAAWSKLSPHAFLGPLSMASWNPDPFHLDSGAASVNDYQNSTPSYLNVFAPESTFDFDSESRPAASTGNRDKGFDELP